MKLEIEYRLFESDHQLPNTKMMQEYVEYWIKPETDIKLEAMEYFLAEANSIIRRSIERAVDEINTKWRKQVKMERRICKL